MLYYYRITDITTQRITSGTILIGLRAKRLEATIMIPKTFFKVNTRSLRQIKYYRESFDRPRD